MHKRSFIVLGRVNETNKHSFISIDNPAIGDASAATNDYSVNQLDLIEQLVPHPHCTYIIRATNDSMVDYGIFNSDLLIVDRSLTPNLGDILIIVIDGELVCKRLVYLPSEPFLVSGNADYPPIPLAGKETSIWGVVTHNIHSF